MTEPYTPNEIKEWKRRRSNWMASPGYPVQLTIRDVDRFLATADAERAARERAERQLAAITPHLTLLRRDITDYELVGPHPLDRTMRALVRDVRALLDASTAAEEGRTDG